MHQQAVVTETADASLAADIGRSAVAFGVGALDAYLCDAFVDSLARTLKVCRRTSRVLPSNYAKLAMPVGPLLGEYADRQNWGLRMSARALMEKDNMLQLGRLKDLLNPALRPGHKLWDDLVVRYVDLDRPRLAGISAASYAALTGDARRKARTKAASHVLKRIGAIVQRRHDIVHNCDRPKSAKQQLTLAAAKKMLTDVEDFVRILDDHLDAHRAY